MRFTFLTMRGYLVVSDVALELCALDAVAPVEQLGCQAALLLYLAHHAIVYPVKHSWYTCAWLSSISHQVTGPCITFSL